MNSRFVTLTDYCVLEYMITSIGDPAAEIVNSDFFLLENAALGSYQIYNTEEFADTTKNSRGLSVVPIGGSKVVKVDLTDSPIYTVYDPNLSETQLSSSLTNSVVMDTMRFHFASGFNFTEVENIILGARQKLNNLKQVQLANVLMNSISAQTLLTFNPKPLFLANTIYDKYIDIKIPNTAYMDQNFEAFGQYSFEYAITGGAGLIKNSPITVSLSEASYEELNPDNGQTYETYRIVGYNEGSISQVNEFDSLGAVIQEASDGDYIEFFATWNGTFPDTLISTLNAQGPDNDWIIIHELQVYEQIGSSEVASGNFVVYQENNFDSPLSYRPILKEAGFAVSMSIDYTARLLNKKTGDQIIRTGSMSLFNPNKYGKKLAKIELLDQPQSMKVYNKIVKKSIEASNLFTGKKTPSTSSSTTQVTTEIKEVKVGVPTFYKQENIRISQRNALLMSADGSSELIFGQGELVLPIDPTDNFIKFIVYEANPLKPGEQKTANLNNNSTFTLNFGKDSKFLYNSLTDPAVENPSIGQIAFKIPKDQAKKILETTDSLMYISLVGEDGTETLMYTGKWMPSSEYATILKAAELAKNNLLNDPQVIIANLRESVQKLESENTSLKNKLTSQKLNDQLVKVETYQNINALSSQVPVSVISGDSTYKVASDPTLSQDFIETTTRKSQSLKPTQTVDNPQ